MTETLGAAPAGEPTTERQRTALTSAATTRKGVVAASTQPSTGHQPVPPIPDPARMREIRRARHAVCPECQWPDIAARTYTYTVVLDCPRCGHLWAVGLKGDGVTR